MTATKALKSLLKFFAIEPVKLTAKTVADRQEVRLTVAEADSGILIGYHGETIDALQLMVNLMANQGQATFKPVLVDINAYRQLRLTQVEALATRAADQSVESGREIILPPLSAFERRQVHLKLQTDPRVSTYSEGEARERRLIVSPKGIKTAS
ncbi:hypothetical protein A2W24_00315 [Microgenomates group bacterium RBG_16_45_19]|nr:MAG: hypothetical protein A2W24_00315 [Microgenomates group bacterium RBG_16_45_19]